MAARGTATNGAPRDLTAAERRVWQAFRRGELLDLGGGRWRVSRDFPVPDEDFGADFGPERTVRASVLARLLLHGPEPEPGAVPALRLAGARITGRLVLTGSRVESYVDLRGCRMEHRVYLDDASFGTLRLTGCVLPAVRARRIRTEGDLAIPACRIGDGVVLTDGQIGTDLILAKTVVAAMNDGRAVAADGMRVGSDVVAGGLCTTGTVSMRSARVGGRAGFYGASCTAPAGVNQECRRHLAFDGQAMQVDQTLHLSAGFRAVGSIRLNDARFGDACVFNSAEVLANDDEELLMWRVSSRALHLQLSTPPLGRIVLNGTVLGALTDVPGTWPGPGRLSVEGLTYDVLRSSQPMTVEQRLEWLRSAPYSPQPYEQLAAAYRTGGLEEEARTVLLAKQRRRRASLALPGKVWGWMQDAAMGYGYRPLRALAWMAALTALGTTLFALHPPQPMKADEAPHWNPFFYTLNLLLPVVSLDQDGAWKTSGAEQWAANGLVLLGWVLAGAVVSGATRVMNRA